MCLRASACFQPRNPEFLSVGKCPGSTGNKDSSQHCVFRYCTGTRAFRTLCLKHVSKRFVLFPSTGMRVDALPQNCAQSEKRRRTDEHDVARWLLNMSVLLENVSVVRRINMSGGKSTPV
ncbi:unnamed protein product [Symbiodinium sp. CCMP2456]|nr:unnamed protein product [Symbiodinium sp. CCMP2456]